MPVYVDEPILNQRRFAVCNMWADSDEELLAMADRIGVSRKAIIGHPELSRPSARYVNWPPFKIGEVKRAEALRRGARQTDRYGSLEHGARKKIASDVPKRQREGKKMLKAVEAAREKRRAL